MSTEITPISTQSSMLGSARRTFVNGEAVARFVVLVILIIGAIIMIAPFAFLISSSLKVETQVFQYPIQWIPDPVRWMNYVDALTQKPFLQYFTNTMIIVMFNQIAVLVTSSLCGYGFARIKFPGRDFWFGVALATMMLPYYVTMVPQFILFSRLGWMDSFLPLIVPFFFGGGAFNVFLFRQFFKTLPEDFSDAARMDGCSEFGIYLADICAPFNGGLHHRGHLHLYGQLERFHRPAALHQLAGKIHRGARPGDLPQHDGVGRTRWDLLMAASVAMTGPIVLLFFILQRYFIKGVVMSGIKG